MVTPFPDPKFRPVDRSTFRPVDGEWAGEPDCVEWRAGLYLCEARRTALGHWCGYVSAPREYMVDDVDVPSFVRALTARGYRDKHAASDYVLGFDCAGFTDRVPGHYVTTGPRGDLRYRTLEDVAQLVTDLRYRVEDAVFRVSDGPHWSAPHWVDHITVVDRSEARVTNHLRTKTELAVTGPAAALLAAWVYDFDCTALGAAADAIDEAPEFLAPGPSAYSFVMMSDMTAAFRRAAAVYARWLNGPKPTRKFGKVP